MPALTGRFSLRVLDPSGDDVRLVTDWMALPHLQQTWEQPWPEQRWAADARARLSGDYSVPLIVSIDGVDAGYIELYRVARDEVGSTYRVDPHDMGLHIAIGETEFLDRGTGSALLDALAAGILAAEPACGRVVADPSFDNPRMHRALTKAGFVDHGAVDVRPDRRIHLFIRTREH